MNTENFDDIRPYRDEEVCEYVAKLSTDRGAQAAFKRFANENLSWDDFVRTITGIQRVQEFKMLTFSHVVSNVAEKTTFSLDLSGKGRLPDNGPFVFMSNHRDIVLDAVFLNLCFIRRDMPMCQIGIGDNLLKRAWIEWLVRLSGSFVVKRGVSIRDMLSETRRLSCYIQNALHNLHESVWIAQRQGRAKNSDDRTQTAVLKMLTMAGEGDFLEKVRALNIIPLSISYEFDPCDFLKAREIQAKRDNPTYTKSPMEDILNMSTGLGGFKGRVHFALGSALNDQLFRIDPSLPVNDQVTAAAALIDDEIHRRYRLYPNNYVALDLVDGTAIHADHYSPRERQAFIDYVISRVALIEPEDGYSKDDDFLYRCILEMYANPARNYLSSKTING